MSYPESSVPSNRQDPTDIDPLLPQKSNSSRQIRTPQIPDNGQALADLELAANDIYEAVLENDQEYDEDEHNEDVVWLREQRLLNKSIHWLKRPSVLMVSTITFLLAFSISSAEATRQVITLKLACNSLGAEKCNKDSAQVLMSNLQLGYTLTGAIIMLISSGKIAPLSDLYGRRPFLIMVILCFLVGKLLKFFFMYNYNTLQFYSMIASEAVSNMGGGLMSLIALCNCYISDVAEPHQRIYALGIGFAAMFVGLSVGPLVGNFIIALTTKLSPQADIRKQEFIPLQFEIAILVMNLLMTTFILPESRSEKAKKKSRTLSRSSSEINLRQMERSPWYERLYNQLNFLKPLKMLAIPNEMVKQSNRHKVSRDRFTILVLAFIDCVMSTMAMSFGEIFILYGIYNYDWAQNSIGHLLAISCSSKAVVLILLSPIINHKILQHGLKFKVFKTQLDMVDFSMCLIGLVCETIGFYGYSLAPTTSIFFIFTVFCGFGTLIGPSINSSIIKFYPESKIGELFGALALVKNIFALVTPVFYLSVYKYSVSTLHRPGLVFVIAGTVLLICTVLLITVRRVTPLDEEPVLSRSNSFTSLSQEGSTSFSELHRKSSSLHKQRSGSLGGLSR
ncbi:Major Facilitator Superfamily protein [Candida parapsilosis]|uniref:MFS domain-containing protein n=2 Tax=Candida parapsilosis TaxID=5480 RepID=G8BA06_CANPC|nr:uncharacterized protein CPAR2_804280 [Candida parapsilosis]KAF6051776.1 Major Facilitator Superfamily protein [Candida parapsilosis]KAF6052718.1 Major Facilitator Superfamily protein [Candida parapsilosis]KAF6053587.1 Major Facilitator Superfamily protein [Candida parapsilosis]KAF6064504.1 Major Facilitator Superfamily protein [Candida parapsilosis]KAI5905889.1 hypothetical protein K4G60_g5160 [Candida parapsilosis]